MSEKLPPGTLCAVCEDIATGKHYSVASCNGCKTFFRRALVNKREFVCQGNKSCPVNKGVRCACRFCRLQKCYAVGMDKNSIQNDRDRIGYTKRKRKQGELGLEGKPAAPISGVNKPSHRPKNGDVHSGSSHDPSTSPEDSLPPYFDTKIDFASLDPIAERLTTLENNFSLMLSRCADLKSYGTLEEALNAPSRFLQSINCDWTDPIVLPLHANEKMPFWRQRLIALYIDWAKTFSSFRALPYADKVALITNHASSFMIMCEAFRTPEHIKEVARKRTDLLGIVATASNSACQSSKSNSICGSDTPHSDPGNQFLHETQYFDYGDMPTTSQHRIDITLGFDSAGQPLKQVKLEPIDSPEPKHEMIRLPTEYGSLPADYASWIPKDYGHPTAGIEGRSTLHQIFDAREFCEVEGRPSSCSFSDTSVKSSSFMMPRSLTTNLPVASLSGITPIMAMMIDLVMKPFRQLNFSTTEFSLLQAIMFFDPDTEGLDSASQRNVIAEQKKLIAVLYSHLQKTYNPAAASERYASILLRLPSIRRAAAKKNESLQVMDMLQMHVMNSLVKETALGPRPTNVQQMMGIGGGAGGISALNPAGE